jgi:apolipoprotein D and lipocalin family protein
MRLTLFAVLVAISSLAFSERTYAQLRTVPYVDVARYLGAWYQISRIPLPFEGNCVCSRQVLSLGEGRVDVYNSCNEPTTGELREIRGFATNDDTTTNARFTVDFGLPRLGQYWIIGLGEDYQYAVVSEPSLSSLYILSKTPTLSEELYEEAVALAAEQMDTSRLVMTPQMGCVYP